MRSVPVSVTLPILVKIIPVIAVMVHSLPLSLGRNTYIQAAIVDQLCSVMRSAVVLKAWTMVDGSTSRSSGYMIVNPEC